MLRSLGARLLIVRIAVVWLMARGWFVIFIVFGVWNIRIIIEFEQNLFARFILNDKKTTLTDQFERRQEQADDIDLPSTHPCLLQCDALDGSICIAQSIEQVFLMQADGRVIVEHFVFAELAEVDRCDDAFVGAEQIKRVHIFQFEFRFGCWICSRIETIGMHFETIGKVVTHLIQAISSLPVALIGKQLLHEFITRVIGFEVDGVRQISIGNVALCGASIPAAGPLEHPRLDLNQRRSHHQKLASLIDVDRINLSQQLDVLIGDCSDGNVGDIDFSLADEKEQQIEWTLKVIEGNSIIILDGLLSAVHLLVRIACLDWLMHLGST